MELRADLPWYRRLHWQVFIAMVAGAATGLLGGAEIVPRIGWLGDLFMRLLKMIIVPLVATSIISGVASVGNGRALGRLFTKTMGFFVLSSLLAIFAGLLVVTLIQPGGQADPLTIDTAGSPKPAVSSSTAEMLLGVVPENVVAAAARPDMLALIFFCILLGGAIATLPERPRETLTHFFDALFQAMMKLTSVVIRLMPIGVFALIARVVGTTGFASFKSLGLFMVTIASGITLHFLITLPVLLFLLGRIDPRVHFRKMSDALLAAFSTSSSNATLPVTLNAVENRVGVSNRISSFVLPMGATINMDATALYQCTGVLFIAQALGVDLTLGQHLVVILTALLVSIGAAAIPSAGLVLIFIGLQAVDLRGPEVEVLVAAMLAVDRPLDMYRTVVNVFSDSCAAAVVARSEGETGIDEAAAGSPA
jgi:Na+/H+-dicarboxylate symporter